MVNQSSFYQKGDWWLYICSLIAIVLEYLAAIDILEDVAYGRVILASIGGVIQVMVLTVKTIKVRNDNKRKAMFERRVISKLDSIESSANDLKSHQKYSNAIQTLGVLLLFGIVIFICKGNPNKQST
jgi:hypothetical protein